MLNKKAEKIATLKGFSYSLGDIVTLPLVLPTRRQIGSELYSDPEGFNYFLGLGFTVQ